MPKIRKDNVNAKTLGLDSQQKTSKKCPVILRFTAGHKHTQQTLSANRINKESVENPLPK